MAVTPPATTVRHIPKLCLHKATGQAIVRLSGKDHYCGRYGSSEAQARYDELIEGWLRNRRQALPVAAPSTGPPPDCTTSTPTSPTVDDVLLAYWHHAEQYYGGSTKALEKIRLAVRPLRRLFGRTPAADFGPKGLKAVRQDLLGSKPAGT